MRPSPRRPSWDRRLRRLALALALLTAALLPPATSAQAGAESRGGEPPLSVTLWPASAVLPKAPRRQQRLVHVRNNTAAPVRLTVEPAEFVQSSDGRVTFHPPGRFSAASWVRAVPGSFLLGAGETREVAVRVGIPDHPEPGERYVGIVFKTPPRKTTTRNVEVVSAVASQLMINVPGKVVHKVVAEKFQAPAFAMWGPIRLRLSLRNAGNVHQSYIRKERIVGTAGGRKVPFPDFTVLGNSRRTVTARWSDPPLFCYCQATVKVATGDGRTVSRAARILIVPVPQILGVLAAALGLFLLTRKGVRYQRGLLAAARGQGEERAD
ncbi:hypothetical protein ACFSL4_11345 [Streptomyces caeni]|uniref:DUF916 domain-containing protein n=1 Tax=Streptomyces caeni TaxID=2307231 RepID=A0ABW4IN67_9ACTN